MSAVENKMNAQSATTEKKRIIVKKSKVVLDETEEEVKTTTDVLSVATEELVEDNIDESEDEEDDASTNPSLEDEEEEIEKMMKELAAKKAAIQQKKMYMAKGKVILADFKKKLEEDKELLDIQINELTAKVEKVEETLADIDDLDTEDADAIAEFLTKNMPKEETIDDLVEAAIRRGNIKKVSTATAKPVASVVATTEKKKGTRTAIDRKSYPNYLLDRMVFKASGNHKTDKLRGKIDLEVVFCADDKKFYNRKNKTCYDTLQDANREWCNARGYEKLGNAWEDFKAFNIQDKKEVVSIQNLHIKNWIADSITECERFIDYKFKF